MPRQIELVGEKEKEDGHVFYFILFFEYRSCILFDVASL